MQWSVLKDLGAEGLFNASIFGNNRDVRYTRCKTEDPEREVQSPQPVGNGSESLQKQGQTSRAEDLGAKSFFSVSIFARNRDVRYAKCKTEDPEMEVEPETPQKEDYVDPELCPEPPEPPQDLLALENEWLELASKGELCVYTCLAFRTGTEVKRDDISGFGFLPTIVALIALQVVVPSLMLRHQIAHVPMGASDTEIEFRLTGFILFLYSIRSMYNNALDECRSLLLMIAFEYNMPFTYVWPLVLGELINSFASFTMCLTLFTVYCSSTSLPDLIINCLAINFIGNVDSEFCSPELREFAVGKFQKVVRGELAQSGAEEESMLRSILEKSLGSFLFLLRVGGTVFFGSVLACVFLLSHEAWLCSRIDLPFMC
jgi:hypothetical protein